MQLHKKISWNQEAHETFVSNETWKHKKIQNVFQQKLH